MPSVFETGLNRLIRVVDTGLRSVTGTTKTAIPEQAAPDTDSLEEEHRQRSVALMRVNHAGEICAQALYEGQALTARSNATRTQLLNAAEEERSHLGWCRERLQELGGKPSVLDTPFYIGSVMLGAAVGLLGDRTSLGFIEATEDQVCQHLDRHIKALPERDERSKAILQAIRDDEAKHQDHAREAGGHSYPEVVRQGMTLASRVMTESTKRI